MGKLEKEGWKILKDPPYSLDLFPYDYFLFLERIKSEVKKVYN